MRKKTIVEKIEVETPVYKWAKKYINEKTNINIKDIIVQTAKKNIIKNPRKEYWDNFIIEFDDLKENKRKTLINGNLKKPK